jgi:hypothetical protein
MGYNDFFFQNKWPWFTVILAFVIGSNLLIYRLEG